MIIKTHPRWDICKLTFISACLVCRKFPCNRMVKNVLKLCHCYVMAWQVCSLHMLIMVSTRCPCLIFHAIRPRCYKIATQNVLTWLHLQYCSFLHKVVDFLVQTAKKMIKLYLQNCCQNYSVTSKPFAVILVLI